MMMKEKGVIIGINQIKVQRGGSSINSRKKEEVK